MSRSSVAANASPETLSAVARKINTTSALLCEWVSKLLIEQTFFQNSRISPETLLYLVNDVIQTLSPPEKTTTLDMVQEVNILYKKLTGASLTLEEEHYDNAPDKILDPTTEILNGLRYSSIFLIGQSLYNSVSSAVSRGLTEHLPAIVGYTAAITVGPQAIRYAVDEALRYTTGLSDTQKDIVRPWLTMIGRLVLGFTPKVHATEEGVHYRYPSTQGHTQTVSPNQTVTLVGDDVTIERHGRFATPEGSFDDAQHVAQFKVHQVDMLTKEKVRIRVVDQSGKPVPVEFHKRQGQYGPEIQVVSVDKELERHWQQYFQMKPTPAIASSSCAPALAMGGAVSLVTQNPLPMVVAGFGCIPVVAARDQVPNYGARIPDHIRQDFYKNYFKKMVLIAGLKAQLQLAQQSSPSTQFHSFQDAQQQSNSYFEKLITNFKESYYPYVGLITQMYPSLSHKSCEWLKNKAEGWGEDLVSAMRKMDQVYQESQKMNQQLTQQYGQVCSPLSFSCVPSPAGQIISNFVIDNPGLVSEDTVGIAGAISTFIAPESKIFSKILTVMGVSLGWSDSWNANKAAFISATKKTLDKVIADPTIGFDDSNDIFKNIGCNALSYQGCQTSSQQQKWWDEDTNPDSPNHRMATQKATAYTAQQLKNIRALLKQQQTEAQQAEFQQALQGMSDTFTFASSLARLFGNPRTAAKIQAIGQATVKLVSALNDIASISATISTTFSGVIGAFSTVMPYLAVADAVLNIISLFSGGGESADDAILQNQKIIMQQLQEIAHEIQEVSQEIQQGFQAMSKDFQQVLQNLNLIFEQIIQGQEITQEIGLQLQASILELRMQMYHSFKDVLDQSFLADVDRLGILVRSGLPANHSAVVPDIALLPKRFFQHAVTDAMTQSTRRGGALMFSVNVNGQARMTQAEADNLGKLPPPEFIQFFQSYFQARYAGQPLPTLVNANMWVEGVNAYLNLLAAFGPTALPFAKQELSRMIQAGINLLKFGKAVAGTPQLFKDLFSSYVDALTHLNNASGTIQQAWQTYAETDPNFQGQIVTPLRQRMDRLVQDVRSFSYDKTPIDQLFPSDFPHAVSDSMDHVIRYNIFFESIFPSPPYPYNLYVSSLTQASAQFPVEAQQKAVETLFELKSPLPFPCIAFNSEGNGPIDVTPVITIPQNVFLAQVLDIADIAFSYVLNTNHSTRYPTFTITGTYTYKNGISLSFFESTYEFKPELMPDNWHYNCNPSREVYIGPTISRGGLYIGNCAVQLVQNPFQDQGNVQGECAPTLSIISPFYSSSYPSNWWPPVMAAFLFKYNHMPQAYTALGQSESAMATYLRLSDMAYSALLIKGWSIGGHEWGNHCPNGGGPYNPNNCLKNNTPPLPNTATWSIADQNDLATKVAKKKEEIIDAFFNTVLNDPQTPGYAMISSALQALNAAYNRLRGYLYFAFPNYSQGGGDPNANPLCAPVNPWSANGTDFRIQNGVRFLANASGLSMMKSGYAVMLRQHEIRMMWSPLDTSEAMVGLRLGKKIVFNVSTDTHEVPIYYTRIHSTQDNWVEVSTALHGFDDQGGQLVHNESTNETWPSASIGVFVQNSETSTQGIRISQATSLQLPQPRLLFPSSANWDTVNPSQNDTRFTDSDMTFYGVNISDPIGWTKLQTNHTIGVMDTDVYVAWQANPGHARDNMTVSVGFGQQAVAAFDLGLDWKSDTWYYSHFRVTSKNITCVTCQNNFDDKGGVQPIRSIQANRFVIDFVPLAIRISNSSAPSGTASVQVKPIQVIGFDASILPQNMDATHWTAVNSTQGILESPDGLTVVGDAAHPQGTSLQSHDTFKWKHKELWLKWRLHGAGSLTLQLANQTVASVKVIQTDQQWMYTRVVVFKSYVELHTATGNYDLNPGSANVTRTMASVTPKKGGIICTVIPQASQSASLTIGECTVQDAAPTLFNQMLQSGALMNRNALLSALLNNVTSPQNSSGVIHTLIRRAQQFQEIVDSLTDLTQHPQDIDPRVAMTMQRLLQAQIQVAVSALNLTSGKHRPVQDITSSHTHSRSGTAGHSSTATGSFSHTRSRSGAAGHSSTGSLSLFRTHTPTVIPTIKEQKIQDSTKKWTIAISIGASSGVLLLLAVACCVLKNRKKSLAGGGAPLLAPGNAAVINVHGDPVDMQLTPRP